MDEDWNLAYERMLRWRETKSWMDQARAAVSAERVEAFALKMILRGQFPSKGWGMYPLTTSMRMTDHRRTLAMLHPYFFFVFLTPKMASSSN